MLAVFALSAAVSAQQTIDLRFNNIEIATTEAKVIQTLGKPSSREKGGVVPCSNNTDFFLLLRYSGLVLELENSGGTSVVATATVTSPKWSVSGIRIGESIGEVKKKLKFGGSRREKGLHYLIYYNGDGSAEFIFQKGKLVKIYWEFNFC